MVMIQVDLKYYVHLSINGFSQNSMFKYTEYNGKSKKSHEINKESS